MRMSTLLLSLAGFAFAASSCVTGGLGLAAGSAYADSYYTADQARIDGQRAQEQRQLQLAQQASATPGQPPQPSTQGEPHQERTLGPDDFASYAEYREYVDRLSSSKAIGTQAATSAARGLRGSYDAGSSPAPSATTVVNNYYYTDYAPRHAYSYRDDLWWEVYFDPWFCVSYRAYRPYPPRYYRPWSYYDPFWPHYGYAPHYGYHAGYHDGYHDGYYDGYWGGRPIPPLYRNGLSVVHTTRRAEVPSMVGYGQRQRSVYAQNTRRAGSPSSDAYPGSARGGMSTRRNDNAHTGAGSTRQSEPTRRNDSAYPGPTRRNESTRRNEGAYPSGTRQGESTRRGETSYPGATRQNESTRRNDNAYTGPTRQAASPQQGASTRRNDNAYTGTTRQSEPTRRNDSGAAPTSRNDGSSTTRSTRRM